MDGHQVPATGLINNVKERSSCCMNIDTHPNLLKELNCKEIVPENLGALADETIAYHTS